MAFKLSVFVRNTLTRSALFSLFHKQSSFRLALTCNNLFTTWGDIPWVSVADNMLKSFPLPKCTEETRIHRLSVLVSWKLCSTCQMWIPGVIASSPPVCEESPQFSRASLSKCLQHCSFSLFGDAWVALPVHVRLDSWVCYLSVHILVGPASFEHAKSEFLLNSKSLKNSSPVSTMLIYPLDLKFT